MSASRSKAALGALLVALLASPAAGVWAATGPDRRGSFARVVAIAATIAAALALVLVAMRRETASVLWAAWIVAGAAVSFLIVRHARENPDDLPEGDVTPPPGAARREVVGALLAAVAAPPVVLLVRLVAAALVGRILVRINPGSLDPDTLGRSILVSFLWAAPAAALFTVLSVRRDRLGDRADLGRATAAWVVLLVLFETVVAGLLRLLRSQSLPADLETWPQPRDFLVQAGVVIAAVPLTLHLAWGNGRIGRRLLAGAALIVAATLNLALVVGLTAEAQFALARLAERSARLEDAIFWYGRTLVARSTALRESYLQHRIGLLHYKLGRVDKARDAFRLVETTRDASPDLVREASWYLQRLEQAREGRRHVLAGVEHQTEHRTDYCAPNSLALVLRYWGRPLTPSEIGQQIAFIGGGTAGTAIPLYCSRLGFDHLLVPFASAADVEWLIDRDLPVLLYLPGHVLAVFGRDARLDTWVAYDTATWDIWVDWPVNHLMPQWGERLFTLGLVLPRSADKPEVAAAIAAARERYDRPAARAGFRWWRAFDTSQPEERRRFLRAALASDPGFFPAALDLAEPATRDWLAASVDVDGVTAAARRFLEREHAPAESLAPEVARWMLLFGRDRELLDLAAQLERRGMLDAVRREAAQAAVRLGEWERASHLLDGVDRRDGNEDEDEDGGDPQADVWRARLATERALGRTAPAADAAAALAQVVDGDERAQAIRAALELGGDRGPVFRAAILSLTRPEDVSERLDYAEAELDASAAEPASRRPRLQSARRAATMALALTGEGAAEGTRARAILARIEAESLR